MGGVVIISILLIGIFYASNIYVENKLPLSFSNIFVSVTIIISAVILVRLAKEVFDNLDQVTDHQSEVAYRGVQISVYLLAFFLVFSVWEIDLSNILLGAGAIGILAALAARQALGAVLSGIIIMATNMFKVGDWLKLEDKFGRVTKITFFNTHFTSHKGEEHIIPNDKITGTTITNMSEKGQYRKDLVVGIDYDSDIERVLDICDNALSELKNDKKEGSIVGVQRTSVKSFDDSSIELSVKIWVKDPTPMSINRAQTEVFKKLHTRFREEDIMIPFPQMTISDRVEEQEEKAITEEE